MSTDLTTERRELLKRVREEKGRMYIGTGQAYRIVTARTRMNRYLENLAGQINRNVTAYQATPADIAMLLETAAICDDATRSAAEDASEGHFLKLRDRLTGLIVDGTDRLIASLRDEDDTGLGHEDTDLADKSGTVQDIDAEFEHLQDMKIVGDIEKSGILDNLEKGNFREVVKERVESWLIDSDIRYEIEEDFYSEMKDAIGSLWELTETANHVRELADGRWADDELDIIEEIAKAFVAAGKAGIRTDKAFAVYIIASYIPGLFTDQRAYTTHCKEQAELLLDEGSDTILKRWLDEYEEGERTGYASTGNVLTRLFNDRVELNLAYRRQVLREHLRTGLPDYVQQSGDNNDISPEDVYQDIIKGKEREKTHRENRIKKLNGLGAPPSVLKIEMSLAETARRMRHLLGSEKGFVLQTIRDYMADNT